MAGILGRLPATDASDTCSCSLSDARRPSSRQGLRKRFRKIRKELADKYGCPFAFESAFISLQDSDVTIEMERFLYGVARSYSECFRVYGENESFEWQQLADEDPVLFTRTGELEKVDILDEDSENPVVDQRLWKKESRSRIMHTFFRRKSHPSPPTQYITMRTPISPLPRVGARWFPSTPCT